ncbi:hypothetical protein GA0061070_103570 [Kosakonia oryziphila]|uniref:Uncharacterized protein n=1 Tax=Kosakonia oryziphila TaxID=1005667 RepID=A0A1C4FFY8_9ENTR|nr:hypothetical protein GA0061070_103570 [Kosakonia oryziphila]
MVKKSSQQHIGIKGFILNFVYILTTLRRKKAGLLPGILPKHPSLIRAAIVFV